MDSYSHVFHVCAEGIVLFQWYMEVAIRCENEMSSVKRLYMQCVDGRSSVDGGSVGLKDYQAAALVLEICREFQLNVDEALSSRPIGEMESIHLSVGEGETARQLFVMSHSQSDLLHRLKRNCWFTEDGFSSVERKRYFGHVLRKLGITLEERHYKRSAA